MRNSVTATDNQPHRTPPLGAPGVNAVQPLGSVEQAARPFNGPPGNPFAIQANWCSA